MSSIPVNGSEPAPTVLGYAPPALGMHSGPLHASATGMQSARQGASVPVVGIVVVTGTLVVTGVDVVGVEVVGVDVVGVEVVGVDVVGTVVTGTSTVGVAAGGAVVESLVSLAAAVGTRTTRTTSAAMMAMDGFTVVSQSMWCGVPDDEPVLRAPRSPRQQRRKWSESPSVTCLSRQKRQVVAPVSMSPHDALDEIGSI